VCIVFIFVLLHHLTLYFAYLYSRVISLAAKKLDYIQIYTEMYEHKIKNVLYKISSYKEHMAENVLKATSTTE